MILITRPNEEAKILKHELTKQGVKCVINSLISFKLNLKPIPFQKKNYYLISSVQSVRTLSKYKKKYLQLLQDGEFLIVGSKVASELKKICLPKIIKVTEDTDAMLKFLLKNKLLTLHCRKIIFLSGSVVNKNFINEVKKKNILLKRVILYSVKPLMLRPATVRLIKEDKINRILLYSGYTAEILLKQIKAKRLQSAMCKIKVYSLSKRIDEIVKNSSLFKETLISKKPSQKSMISLLGSKKTQ